MIGRLTILASLAATPAFAASGPFFSLNNTDFVVLIAFLVFIGVLVYFKVPGKLSEMLDKRAQGIEADLAEARGLREEAQTLLASYERKQQEAKDEAERIVARAKSDAEAAAEKARADLQGAIARRLQAAEEQIASAEQKAVREVRNKAIQVATAAAAEVLTKQMDGARADQLVDDAIRTVESRLH